MERLLITRYRGKEAAALLLALLFFSPVGARAATGTAVTTEAGERAQAQVAATPTQPPGEAAAQPPDEAQVAATLMQPAPAAPTQTAAAQPPSEAPAQSGSEATAAGASEGPGGPPSGARRGLVLPGGLSLNGYFDVAYERRGYTDDPTDGHNELHNYHHFVFLSRHVATSPLGINIELVDLTFYEVTLRFGTPDSPWRGGGRIGKVLVPFGPDPLFHTTYGGRAGFDQELLPIIWSELGAVAQGQYAFANGINLKDDLYIVQGFALPNADAVLNLQSDLSPTSSIEFGYGNRLALGYGPVSAYYSAFVNPLGFDRTLFMQALDVVVYRWPSIPVVRDFVLKAGIARADVSGGGAGADYYHFGDYVELRYFPLDWLFVQARTGIVTFDNRRGLYLDNRRKSSRDRTSHNLGVGVLYRGLIVSLYHYWNLEKVNEQPDDFLRLWVTYAF